MQGWTPILFTWSFLLKGLFILLICRNKKRSVCLLLIWPVYQVQAILFIQPLQALGRTQGFLLREKKLFPSISVKNSDPEFQRWAERSAETPLKHMQHFACLGIFLRSRPIVLIRCSSWGSSILPSRSLSSIHSFNARGGLMHAAWTDRWPSGFRMMEYSEGDGRGQHWRSLKAGCVSQLMAPAPVRGPPSLGGASSILSLPSGLPVVGVLATQPTEHPSWFLYSGHSFVNSPL